VNRIAPTNTRQNEELLRRIRTRRQAIKATRGVLTESYPLIREDRERMASGVRNRRKRGGEVVHSRTSK
jgi:hypothetical protein